MKIGVIDKDLNKYITEYDFHRIRYDGEYGDSIKYLHFEVADGKYAQAYLLDGLGNLTYDVTREPVIDVLRLAQESTEERHFLGFILYRKIAADIALDGTLSSIDSTLAIYPSTLMVMRCYLKDGMGETALRFLIKTIEPMGLFTAEKILLYKTWLREYCHLFKPDTYTDFASYDLRLDEVETEMTI